MLCDHCHKHEAVVHVKEIIDGKTRELHLCAECAADVGKVAEHLGDMDISSLPDEVAAVIALEAAKKAAQLAFGGGNDEAGEPEDEDGRQDTEAGNTRPPGVRMRCEVCGLTAAEFRKTGRMGCDHCYETFASLILPALKGMHRGLEHCGVTPDDPARETSPDRRETLRCRLQALHEELRRAVSAEAYEEAARIRDLIRQIEAQAAAAPAETRNDADTS